MVVGEDEVPDQQPRARPHGVVITQRDVYDQVQSLDEKIDALTTAVSDMVNINKRLDAHHDRLNSHSERLRTAEGKLHSQGVIIYIMTAVIVAAVIAVLIK